MIKSLDEVLNRVPKGVIIWCVCLGKDKKQFEFLLLLIKHLKPEFTYVFDPDLDEGFLSTLNRMINVKANKNYAPNLILGANTLIYAPYCHYKLMVNFVVYNADFLGENFSIISYSMDFLLEAILTNINDDSNMTRNQHERSVRMEALGAAIIKTSKEINLQFDDDSNLILTGFNKNFKIPIIRIEDDSTMTYGPPIKDFVIPNRLIRKSFEKRSS